MSIQLKAKAVRVGDPGPSWAFAQLSGVQISFLYRALILWTKLQGLIQ